MRIVHLTVLVVGGHWALKVHDGDRFHIAGSSVDKPTIEALAHRLSADCIARGHRPVLNIFMDEAIAA